MVVSIDASVLTAYYQARAGVPVTDTSGGSTGSTTGAATGPGTKTPTPPWSSSSAAPQMSALTKSVLGGAKFIDESAAKLDVPTASADYKRLFALYQGLDALNGLAQQMTAKGTSAATKAQIQARFAVGLQEVGAYVDKTSFDGFQLAQTAAAAKLQSSVGVKLETDTYTTGPVWSGDPSAPVDAFQGPVAFAVTADKTSGPVTVNFDLSEMGDTPRTMANVVIYMNGKLQAAGLFTRVAVVRNPGSDRTTTVNGKSLTLGKTPDSFSFKISGVVTEPLSFSAPAAGPAVYVGGTVGTASGKTPSAAAQIVKYETDPSAGATAAADGKISTDSMGAEVEAVRASAVAPDGSLYVLADVDGTTGGQPIKGATDVALKKYDSAGNLVYTRTLGATDNASGYALAVSADGSRVAIAGSVTGALDNGDSGADSQAADSFVGVFNAEGEQLWSQRDAAKGDDHVTGLAFAADGSLYVTGDTASAMPGATAVGGQDIFVQGFTPAGSGAAAAYKPAFTVQYGASTVDKAAGVAVSGGALYAAGVENGHAVVRRYDLQATGAPTLAALRDLGPLQGGGLAGIAVAPDGSVVVAGSTHNGGLDAGTVTTAYGGAGEAGFVAKLSSSLAAGPGETLSYLNRPGDLTATAMTVSGGQVYLTGQESIAPPPGQTSAYDGYAAAVDPATGAVSWSQSFRGADRTAAPTTIAVDASGASVLDRLGLPAGAIDYKGSQQIVANSSVRAGDQFEVQVNGGAAHTVTVDAADTLQTLATKIGRATGFMAQASVVASGGVDQLKIVPINTHTRLVLSPGKTGRDALAALGLNEGLITTAPDANPKDSVKANYGLGLPSTLALDSDADVKQAQAKLAAALSTVKKIYSDLTAPPKTASTGSGTVPAYVTNQIANYQQALQRLTSGG